MLTILRVKNSVTVEDSRNSVSVTFKKEQYAKDAECHIRSTANKYSWLTGQVRDTIEQSAVCFKGKVE